MRIIKFRFWSIEDKEMSKPIDLFDMDITEGLIPMQFTGLKDKNGKEIYEGDVLKHDYDNNIIVEYEEDFAGFNICYSLQEYYSNDNIEVIGNIYENPELIK